jgi:O-antigen ligase
MRPPSSNDPGWPHHRWNGHGGSINGHASRLELFTLVHVAVLVIFTAWDFGGETDFARVVISAWGSLALPILAAVCWQRRRRGGGCPAALRWLWPLLAFDALVLAGTLNPSFAHSQMGGVTVLVHSGAFPGWPSCARPVLALETLWQFNAIYLACFNLVLVIVRRRLLRSLLVVVTTDALALAVMGTFQKLDRAPGLYFGLQPSPNDEFFASFIYRNHWGAFVLLAVAAALSLLFHHARRADGGDRRHSPVLFGLVCTLFLAASVPLSGSRAGTLLVAALLCGAVAHWLQRLWREGRLSRRSQAMSMALVVVVFLSGLAGIYALDRPAIATRVAKTREQIEEIHLRGGLGSREQLYRDTWRMAQAKIWFGWGLGSYPTVFQMFNQQISVEGWVPFYSRAHSDWLQAWAETGAVGLALLLLTAAVPLVAVLRRGRPGAVTAYLLAGCGLLVLYALVEFPLANPAVMEAFWLSFFTALRYHRLSQSGPCAVAPCSPSSS